MKPFVTSFEEDETGDLSKEWKIIKIASRRGGMKMVLTRPCQSHLVQLLDGMHSLHTKVEL